MLLFTLPRNCLASRLICSIGLVMVGGGIFFWYFFFKNEEKTFIANSLSHAESFVNIVKITVRFGMLTKHRNNIQYNVALV